MHDGEGTRTNDKARKATALKKWETRLAVAAGGWATSPNMRFVPPLPRRFRAKYASPRRVFDLDVRVPSQLAGTPGVLRDPELEEKAFAEAPLPDFMIANLGPLTWLRGFMWRAMLPAAPRRQRAAARADRVAARAMNVTSSSKADPAVLGKQLKDLGAELGLGAVGFAAWDEKYIFKSSIGTEVGDRLIVCLLEQAWEPTQQIPSATSEQTALSTYAECMNLASRLGELLVEGGYRVKIYDAAGPGMAIPFAVAAGLGQLGLNGQLLSAWGSRCRIIMVNTDAPLPLDSPKDFGVKALCDACQVCVKRCPPGAIPANRRMKRGIEKAPINTKRCLPVVAQAHGCAICMKVCPVQRYGLQPVLDEFAASGRVMGKGTDELEGYHWPLDGRHYGPGEKPRMSSDLTDPPGMPEIVLGQATQDLTKRQQEQARGWA